MGPCRPFTQETKASAADPSGKFLLACVWSHPAHGNTCSICSQTGEAGFQNCRFEPGTFKKCNILPQLHRTLADKASGVYAGTPILVMHRDIIFILLKKLEYICFTVSCWLLQHNEVTQPYACLCPLLPLEPPSLPTPPSHSPSHHRAPSRGLCVSSSRQPSVVRTGVYKCGLPGGPSLPFPCPQVCSLHFCLYSWPANRLTCTIFTDSTCYYFK